MKKTGLGFGKQNDSLNLNKIDSFRKHASIRKRSLQISGQSLAQSNLEVLTFGDWKQIPIRQKQKNENFQTIQYGQQKNSSHSMRVKQYQDMRLKKVNESERYRPKPLFPSNNTIIRKFCIDSDKRKRSINSLDSSRRKQIKSQRVNPPQINQKEIFKILYKRQRDKYEALLEKYGIEQKMQDNEFEQFCG